MLSYFVTPNNQNDEPLKWHHMTEMFTRKHYLSSTTRSVAVSALLCKIFSRFWIFSSRSQGSHLPFKMEAVRPKMRGQPGEPSQICKDDLHHLEKHYNEGWIPPTYNIISGL